MAATNLHGFAVRMDPRGPPIDEDELDTLEYVVGSLLPITYRAFLTECNGGTPDPGVLYIGRTQERVRELYSIGAPVLRADLRRRYYALRGIVPGDSLAIGRTDGGLLLLGLAGANWGKVHVLSLDVDARRRGQPPRLVARTFDGFLHDLARGARRSGPLDEDGPGEPHVRR